MFIQLVIVLATLRGLIRLCSLLLPRSGVLVQHVQLVTHIIMSVYASIVDIFPLIMHDLRLDMGMTNFTTHFIHLESHHRLQRDKESMLPRL
jgi:hypothetical protein